MYKISGRRLYRDKIQLCYADIFCLILYYSDKCYYFINKSGNTTHYFGPFVYHNTVIPLSMIKKIRNMLRSEIVNEELCEYIWNITEDEHRRYQYIMRTEFDYIDYGFDESYSHANLDKMFYHLFNFKLSPTFAKLLEDCDDEFINHAFVSLRNQVSDILSRRSRTKSAKLI